MWTELAERLERYFWSYGIAVVVAIWVVTTVGATYTYFVQINAQQKSFGGFLNFCFPSVILRHRSCRLDLIFSFLMRFIHIPLILMITNVAVAELCYRGLTSMFGPHRQNHEAIWLWIAILVAVVILQDFMTFYVHYLEHRVRALWELHKVHHSTEFLLPLSNRRFHPLQAIVDNFGNMAAVGLALGVTSYFFSLPIHDNSIIGLDGLFVVNILSFYHLRHSHIPMRYGWLERHLISPAQHQLHHSREERHWDKNFGLCFSWWDRWFGTIVYSTPGEKFALGLPQDIQHEYDNVRNCSSRQCSTSGAWSGLVGAICSRRVA